MGTFAASITRTYGNHEATHVDHTGKIFVFPYNLVYHGQDMSVYTLFLKSKPGTRIMLKTYWIPSKKVCDFKIEVHKPVATNRVKKSVFTGFHQIKSMLAFAGIPISHEWAF